MVARSWRDRVPSPVLVLKASWSELGAPRPSLCVQLFQVLPSNIETPPSVPNHTRSLASTPRPYTHSLISSRTYVVNLPVFGSTLLVPAQVPIHSVPSFWLAKQYTQ